MQGIPLFDAASADTTVAWRAGRPVGAAQFLADVARLAAQLPPAGHFLNACVDRYRFAVALCASLLAERVTLLPPDHTPQTVRRLREFDPGVQVLADEATPAIDLPRVAVPAAPASVAPAFDVPAIPADRLCAIVFTSGSTGTPVPNRKHWGALRRNVRGALERWAVSPARPAIVATVPPQHMYGFESTVLSALFGGGTLCAERPFYPGDIAAALERLPRPRMLVTTPLHLRALLDDIPQPPAADLLLCATAPLDPALATLAEARFGAPLLEIYGCTETGQMASRHTTHGPEWRTLPGVRVALREGRAWASGGHVEQPTALGDTLEPLAEDRFLLGARLTDTINVAGKRSSLAHLEAQLRALEGVADCAFYLPDETPGARAVTRLVAFAVAPGRTRESLLAELRARIDPAFLPRPLVLLERLPRAETGKLPREALRALARTHGADGAGGAAARRGAGRARPGRRRHAHRLRQVPAAGRPGRAGGGRARGRHSARAAGRRARRGHREPAGAPGVTARWRRAPERSHRLVLRLMRGIALFLGRRAARLLLHPISAYFLAFAPAARRASAGYLARVLGRRATLAERYRHLHRFAATVLDRVYLLHERFALFDIEVHGEPALQAELARGRGALLVGAHLGSFEALRAPGRRATGLRVAMVMYEENARMLNETLAALSPDAQLDVIPLGRLESMLRVRDFLAAGGIAGVLADRGLGDEDARAVDFLGAPARFPLGPWRMAAMLRARVLFMAGLYHGGNRYSLHFEPLADFSASPAPAPEAALAAYAACLERHCRAAPFNWFNFFEFWDDARAH